MFDRPAATVLIAHLLLGTDVLSGGPIGLRVADYVLELEVSETIVLPIRETFDISAPTPPDLPSRRFLGWWAASATFLAPWSEQDRLHPRRSGPWEAAGLRMSEAYAGSEGYRLWWWRDEGGRLARSLEVRPRNRAFMIAGVTIGDVHEDPISLTAREPVAITLLGPLVVDAANEQDLEMVVDRGVSSYVWPA